MKNFTRENLYDAQGVGSEEQKIRKIKLLYVDCKETLLICDCCDEKKPLAHFTDVLGKNSICICKDCLQLIINEFGDE